MKVARRLVELLSSLLLPAAGAPSGALLGLLGAPLGFRAALRLMTHHDTTTAIVPAQAWTLGSFLLLAAGEGVGLLPR